MKSSLNTFSQSHKTITRNTKRKNILFPQCIIQYSLKLSYVTQFTFKLKECYVKVTVILCDRNNERVMCKVFHIHNTMRELLNVIYSSYLPSLQNFPRLLGSWRNENFCKSAYVSANNPHINMPVPAESNVVIVFGAFG